MSVFDPEQLIASQKANAVTLFALTNQAFGGFQKLIEVVMRTVAQLGRDPLNDAAQRHFPGVAASLSEAP